MALTKILTEGIKDGEIVNVDINANAQIARTKLTNVDLVDDTSPQLGGHLDVNDFQIKNGTSIYEIVDNARHKFSSGGNQIIDINGNGVDFLHGNNTHADNVQSRFGSGNDLKIYHDGSNSRIENATGHIVINTDSLDINNAADSETLAKFDHNGAVSLYYDGGKKLETTSSGVLLSGHLDLNDGNAVKLGSGDDLQIYHDGSNSYVNDTGTGDLLIGGDANVSIVNSAASEFKAKFITNGAVELYHDNVKKFQTDSLGASLFGNLYQADNDKLILGTGSDLQIYHDGSNSFIQQNGQGNLFLQQLGTGNDKSVIIGGVGGGSSAEKCAEFINNGAVQLFYDNNVRLETHNDGLNFRSTNYNSSATHWCEGGFKPWANDTYDLGDASYRWRNIHCNDGILFQGNNTTATTLDDYEEGTFDAINNYNTVWYSNENTCAYTKIGRVVTVMGQIRQYSGSGNLILGLPFTVASGTESEFCCVGTLGIYDQDTTSNAISLNVLANQGDSFCYFMENVDNGAWAHLQTDGSAYLRFTFTYFTTS